MRTATRLPAKLAVLGCGLCLISLSGDSQASSLSYVASVRPSQAARGGSEFSPGGRLTAAAVTARTLLRLAYRIQDDQLVGAPGWLSTERFDISAKAEDTPPPSQQALVQAVLRDRFQLLVHRETRELPLFALVLARNDGKPGPQLRPSNFDCATYRQRPHAPPEAARTAPCSARINRGAISARSITMEEFATRLAPFLQRFTADKTGMTGGFDVELTWTPERTNGPQIPPQLGQPDDASGLSLFAALQEQLGLKLVSEKGPVEVVVVDRVEEPSGN